MDDNSHFRSDAELVSQTLAGDQEAFGQLYDRYARLVRAVAFDGSRDPATVQDLTQEIFLRAFRKLATLREGERFGSWVVGIARQVVREHRRLRWPGSLDGVAPESLDNPTASVGDADEVEHLLRQVSRLPEAERLAVHLFFLNERDADETARLLNRSRSGTYGLLKRACGRLARWLGAPEREREGQP